MKSRMKKVLSFVLALCMVATVCAVHVFADRKKPYAVYTSFGDSIAAGLGLPDYHTTYDSSTGSLGDGDRIPGSYPDLVASAVDADLIPLAHQGFRSNELRMVLDDTYMGDVITFSVLKNLVPEYQKMSEAEVAMSIKSQKASYVDAIQKSNLITLQIGSNDLMEAVMVQLFVTAWGYPIPGKEPAAQVQKLLDRFGSIGKVYEYMAKEITGYQQSDTSLGALLTSILEDENIQKVVSTTQTLAGFLNTILEAEDGFKENMEYLAETIHSINPDAKVILVGLYNPFRDSQLNSSIPLKLGHVMDITLGKMNAMQMEICNKYDNFTYVSDWDAEVIATMNLDEIDVNDSAFFSKISSYVHPSANGHAYIADQILKALPDEWEGRVVRQNPSDKKWYLYDGENIAVSYTGLGSNENGTWYVKKGKVDFTYTGFAADEAGDVYRVVKGKVDTSASGVVGNGKDWRYVKNGKVQNVTGVYKNAFGWWYVENGKVNFSYKGIAKNSNGWWYIEGGKVNFLKTGKVTVNGTTYRVLAGRVLK